MMIEASRRVGDHGIQADTVRKPVGARTHLRQDRQHPTGVIVKKAVGRTIFNKVRNPISSKYGAKAPPGQRR